MKRSPKAQVLEPLDEAKAQTLFSRVIEIYARNFSRCPQAREFLAARGITDLSLLEGLNVGWSDGGLPPMLPEAGSLRAELTRLGVLTSDGQERHAESLLFPMYDAEGRIANVWSYSVTGGVSFLPNRPIGLWNVAAAKLAPQLYVTSDIFDSLALKAAGYANVAAVPENGGPVDLGELTELGIQKVVLVLGATVPAETSEQFRAKFGSIPISIASLKGSSGAADFSRQHGGQALAESVVAAVHGLTAVNLPGMQPLPGGFTLTLGARRYEIRGLDHSPRRLKATIRAEFAGRIHVDTLDFYAARARRQLVTDLVRFCAESFDRIEAEVMKLLTACEARCAQPELAQAMASAEPIAEADRKEAEAMGRDPKLVEMIVADLERCGVVGEKSNKLLAYLAITSRKLARPLAVMTLSSSGSGKSTLQDAVCRLCPPEDLVKVTALSGKALFYKERGSLQHKVLVLEESEGMKQAAYALRNLISAGELISEVAVKDAATGRLVTMTNKVSGPVAVLLTTTSPDLDSETKSRFFVTNTDESREQTRAILEFQRQQQGLDGLAAAQGAQEIIRRHHTFQRLLQPVSVVNPHAKRLNYDDRRLSSRRDQPKILRLIEAVAFLRQLAKPVRQLGAVNYVEVDETDLRIAASLANGLFGQVISELSHPGQELLIVLEKMRAAAGQTGNGEKDSAFSFTRRQVREFANWANSRVHRYLTELIEFEYVLRASGRRGMPERYLLAAESGAKAERPFLLFPFESIPGSGSGVSGVFQPADLLSRG
jgi:hypothetical protein